MLMYWYLMRTKMICLTIWLFYMSYFSVAIHHHYLEERGMWIHDDRFLRPFWFVQISFYTSFDGIRLMITSSNGFLWSSFAYSKLDHIKTFSIFYCLKFFKMSFWYGIERYMLIIKFSLYAHSLFSRTYNQFHRYAHQWKNRHFSQANHYNSQYPYQYQYYNQWFSQIFVTEMHLSLSRHCSSSAVENEME